MGDGAQSSTAGPGRGEGDGGQRRGDEIVRTVRTVNLVDHTDVWDVVSLMPEMFFRNYEELVTTLYPFGSNRVSDPETMRPGDGGTRWRTSSSQTETRAGAKRGRRGVGQGTVVRDSRLFVLKEKVDRQLRKLGKLIETGGDGSTRKCTGCARFADSTWNWCPWCGKRTEEIDG